MIDHKINEKLIPLDQIDASEWNPNEMSDYMRQKLHAAVEEFGFVTEIIVYQKPDGRYGIIDGHHRYNEALAQGMTEILANDLGPLSEDQAKILNRVMDDIHGERNPIKLSRILTQLSKDSDWDSFKEVLPMTEAEIDNLLVLEVDKSVFDDGPVFAGKEPGADLAKAWVDLKMTVSEDQFEEFQKLIYKAKTALGIEKMADPALENGALLKELLDRRAFS